VSFLRKHDTVICINESVKEDGLVSKVRSFLLLPVKLIFGVFWLVLALLNIGVKLLAELGSIFLGIILVILALMFIGYFVLVEPGQISTSAKDILFSIATLFIVSTILALVPSLMDGLINLCNRVLQL